MNLQELVLGTVKDQLADKIGASTGVDGGQVSDVIEAALPDILKGLQKNTSSSSGAEALDSAITKDHDGSLLDSLGSLFGGSDSNSDGGKILDHVLGQARTKVEQRASKKSGVDIATVAKILTFVAPLVLAYLGRQKKHDSLDSGGLQDMLQKQDVKGGLLDMAKDFIDKNNDGSVVDDVLGMLKK